MIGQYLSQIAVLVRLELRKTFFARRGLWIYLLAFAPAVLFFGNSVYAPRERARLARIAAAHPLTSADMAAFSAGAQQADVVRRIGEPYSKREWRRQSGPGMGVREFDRYTDGKRDYSLIFADGVLRRIERTDPGDLQQDSLIFAAIFQFYFLRLAVFLGCVGIFVNLFRGEMLDKSLHFYLLTPVCREVLAAGKYLAGLIATTLIFTASAAVQQAAMLWQYRGPELAAYLNANGWHVVLSYLGVTALACLGYGSVFLLAGLIFRNPIIPAAVVLLWESANLFLPPALKTLSLIFYLQSLCPVVPPADSTMPTFLRMLVSAPVPIGDFAAIACVAILSLIVIVLAGLSARRLEINYSAE